jgi:hypothetical protein
MCNSISFFPENIQEFLRHETDQLAYNVLDCIHHANFENISNLKWFSISNMMAVLFKKDHALLAAIRRLYRIGMGHLAQSFQSLKLSDQFEMSLDFLYSSLCFLPYWEWQHDESPSIEIPQYVNHRWQLIPYRVTCIELTPKTGFQSVWLTDYDRAYAYGLTPLTQQSSVSPMLIFSGSTYPAGAGANTYLLTDLEAFRSAGQSLFASGQERIMQWVNQNQIHNFHVMGMSLGGSMTLLTCLHMPEYIDQAFALNPPALYELPKVNHPCTPKVRVMIQCCDPVSKFGVWHPDWHVVHLNFAEPHPKQNPFLDHILIYSGLPFKHYLTISAPEENEKRFWLNLLIFKGLRSLFYLSFILPYYYFVQPLVRLLYQEKWFLLSYECLKLFGFVAPGLNLLTISVVLGWAMQAYFEPESFLLPHLLQQGYFVPFIVALLEPFCLGMPWQWATVFLHVSEWFVTICDRLSKAYGMLDESMGYTELYHERICL